MDPLAAFGGMKHGGRLQIASQAFGIPVSDWLDLSTGINPLPWPIPSHLLEACQKLPEVEPSLEPAIQSYYGQHSCLLGSGSQQWISWIPFQLTRERVWIPRVGYFEHYLAWKKAGHEVLFYDGIEETSPGDRIVLVNPNNPSTYRYPLQELERWLSRIRRAGGLLVVDEAFIDTRPHESLLNLETLDNVVVLRSIGKFFGLPGLRLGFVFASDRLIETWGRDQLPWQVNSLGMAVLPSLLTDKAWHKRAINDLIDTSDKLRSTLRHWSDACLSQNDFFVTLKFTDRTQARKRFESLARQGILSRWFEQEGWLRFGLPASHSDFERFESAILKIAKNASV